jgi:Protein of unknown function (DUF3617)
MNMPRNLLALTLAAACTPALAQQMEPGEWKFDTTMTSPMMPKPQVSSFTRCVKPEEAGDPASMMGKPQPQSDCQMTPGTRSAHTYTWEMSCPKSGMQGRGTVRYGRGTLESEMKMTGEMQGRKLDMTTKTKGKRLGPCKSK